jgi:hypothetical protein
MVASNVSSWVGYFCHPQMILRTSNTKEMHTFMVPYSQRNRDLYCSNIRTERFRSGVDCFCSLCSIAPCRQTFCDIQISWRMSFSGMLRRMTLVRTDVSEEYSASVIRVVKIGELETTFAVTSNRRVNIPEDGILHSHRSKNLKSYRYLFWVISQYT